MITQQIAVAAEYGALGILWFLFALSVISVAMMIERFLTLRGISNYSQKMQDRLEDALQTNSLEDLEHLSKERDSIEAKALTYGLRHVKENGTKGLEEIFNSYKIMEKARLEKFLNFLATVGSNAPFVGLLGTVLGIMKAFQDLSSNEGNAGMQVVQAGISEALIATAVGLFVAIPAVVAYNYFSKQVRGILQGIDSVRELCIAYAYKKGEK